jgi:hypothetical protein
MSNDQPSRRPPAKSTGGGAPMGSTISIVVAVLAVVVGFIILRNISSDNSSTGSSKSPTTTQPATSGSTAITSDPTQSTLPEVVTPTTTPLVFTGGSVVVANASGLGGAAGTATKALTNVGFTMGKATDAVGAEKKITLTKVYYKPGSEALAASVAKAFGAPGSGVLTAPLPTPIPVAKASIGDSVVVVMLGTDMANKPLPILGSSTSATTATGATTVTPANNTPTSGA